MYKDLVAVSKIEVTYRISEQFKFSQTNLLNWVCYVSTWVT